MDPLTPHHTGMMEWLVIGFSPHCGNLTNSHKDHLYSGRGTAVEVDKVHHGVTGTLESREWGVEKTVKSRGGTSNHGVCWVLRLMHIWAKDGWMNGVHAAFHHSTWNGGASSWEGVLCSLIFHVLGTQAGPVRGGTPFHWCVFQAEQGSLAMHCNACAQHFFQPVGCYPGLLQLAGTEA